MAPLGPDTVPAYPEMAPRGVPKPLRGSSKPFALRSLRKSVKAPENIPKSGMDVRSIVPLSGLGLPEIWEVHPGRQGQALCEKLDLQDVYPEWD